MIAELALKHRIPLDVRNPGECRGWRIARRRSAGDSRNSDQQPLVRSALANCTAATPSMEIAMFDHIGIGVSDLAYSKKFFLDALAPLGVAVVMEFPEAVGLGPPGKPAFWLSPTGSKPTQLHLAFIAESHSKVDEFYRCAIAAGAKDNGAPGLRPE